MHIIAPFVKIDGLDAAIVIGVHLANQIYELVHRLVVACVVALRHYQALALHAITHRRGKAGLAQERRLIDTLQLPQSSPQV